MSDLIHDPAMRADVQKAVDYANQAVSRAESIREFIETLELPEAEKQRLVALTPGNYVGKAAELARKI